MSFRFLMAGALALAAIPLSESYAHACGGCFIRPTEVTVVSGHRMVFSISQSRSILWDQFSYSGDPSEFAWVLPVHAASVKLELAHDEFIAALDAYSTPTIVGPSPNNGGGGIGCGAANSAYEGGDSGVQVISQEVVGPYEVATLRSTDPQALENWLAGHGYTIPQSVQPTVAAYVNDGFDFIALRLLPGKGVAAMQPVRVVSNGADPTLPLRMVAAGVGTDVSIVLYVISEGRYEAANFDNVKIDATKLVWNKATAKSNYDDLAQQALTQGDGRNWLLDFAGHMQFSDFAHTQFASAYQSAVLASKTCAYGKVHGPDFPAYPGFDSGVTFNDSGTTDANADADDASTDASDDAAIDDAGANDASDDGGTTSTDAGTSDAGDGGSGSYDNCYFDDFTTATAGMNASDVVLTRLHADLKTSALDQDLVLKAAADQSFYDNYHYITQNASGCATASSRPDSSLVVIVMGALGTLLWKRRRAR
jgi:hypothetical protein